MGIMKAVRYARSLLAELRRAPRTIAIASGLVAGMSAEDLAKKLPGLTTEELENAKSWLS